MLLLLLLQLLSPNGSCFASDEVLAKFIRQLLDSMPTCSCGPI